MISRPETKRGARVLSCIDALSSTAKKCRQVSNPLFIHSFSLSKDRKLWLSPVCVWCDVMGDNFSCSASLLGFSLFAYRFLIDLFWRSGIFLRLDAREKSLNIASHSTLRFLGGRLRVCRKHLQTDECSPDRCTCSTRWTFAGAVRGDLKAWRCCRTLVAKEREYALTGCRSLPAHCGEWCLSLRQRPDGCWRYRLLV